MDEKVEMYGKKRFSRGGKMVISWVVERGQKNSYGQKNMQWLTESFNGRIEKSTHRCD